MPRLIKIIHEPAHWNDNCNCTIPAAWVGIVESKRGTIRADSPDDVVRYARLSGVAIPSGLAIPCDLPHR
jgi:hypothetical protein